MKITKLLTAAALASAAFAAQPAPAKDLKLEFVVWNYSLETIQDNIKLFQAANPGITVNVTDYTWPDYQDSIVLRFRGNTPTDVIYGGQDWLPAWGRPVLSHRSIRWRRPPTSTPSRPILQASR